MLTDAELVDGVVAGYDDAFAQLYRRHSLAAWRLGQTVTGNADDASDAVSEAFARVLVAVRAGHLDNGGSFRSYLLTATRNAALDNIRKTGRSRPTEQETLSEVESASPSPPELLTSDEEAALVAEAFRNLPERWQSVLWLTEVEGIATKDAARRLGLSPNGAAQLAVRARTGLRERFLQAHLRTEADPQCRTTVDRLGAYVGGGLAPRDLAKVDQHLAGCVTCEARRKELDELGSCLRRAGVPAPLLLTGALGAGGSTVLFTVGDKAARVAEWAQQAWAQKAAAVAAAGALALGAGGAYIAGSDAEEAAAPAPAISISADPAEPPPASTSLESSAPGPAPTPPNEGDPTPVAPTDVSLAPEGDQVVTKPACTGLQVGAGAATVNVGTGERSLARESSGNLNGDSLSESDADGERAVATLGGVLGHDGFDRDAEPPPVNVDLDLSPGDLAARLALAADMSGGGGLELGVDVGPGGAGSSTTCGAGLGTGVGAGLELGTEGLRSP